MASLGDLFNPSFLIFLGILVLVAALLVVYFESKMRDQNHKISSMISLVSTLAEDMNNIKFGMNQLAISSVFNGGSNNQFNNNSMNLHENDNDDNNNNDDNEKKLITVSDDESNSDSDDSDDDSNADSDDDDEDEVESKSELVIDLNSDIESDKNSEIDEIDDANNNNIKILKLNIKNDLFENIEENNGVEDLEDLEDLEVLEDNLSDSESVNFEANNDEITNELSIELKNNIIETNNSVQENSDANLQISESTLKSININLEESNNESQDYKKFSLTKLRSIVSEKGLSTDTTKLKKQDLFKLLGVE